MRYKKTFIIIGILIIAILLIIIFQKQFNNNYKKICIEDKKCFEIELADTPEERVSGLSNRKILEKNSSMLFVFEDEKITGFWMKDMKFSIDIIWINKNMEITGIEKSLEPCTENSCPAFYPEEKIKYVLEINSGISEEFGFEKGDIIYLK